MSDVSKFQIGGTDVNVKDASARTSIGTLTALTTTAKSNLVAAINEIDAKPGGMTATYDSTTEKITFA